MRVDEIREVLERLSGYHSVFVPEFTFGDKRIDAVSIDFKHRWIRGFEIKINHNDFERDKKWTEYTEFLSSLSIVCPSELILKEEVQSPFGLLWVEPNGYIKWKKRPTNFQSRKSLSWFWTYLRVMETEFSRMSYHIFHLENEIKRLKKED